MPASELPTKGASSSPSSLPEDILKPLPAYNEVNLAQNAAKKVAREQNHFLTVTDEPAV